MVTEWLELTKRSGALITVPVKRLVFCEDAHDKDGGSLVYVGNREVSVRETYHQIKLLLGIRDIGDTHHSRQLPPRED